MGKYYASVFFAEQAAEKALKATYIHLKKDFPFRIYNLVELLQALDIDRNDLIDAAMDLTPEYIVTRYPDAANGIPAYLYNEKMAKDHLEKSRNIVNYCKEILEGSDNGTRGSCKSLKKTYG
ncbi:MAG: HEPN domain-containing protein [Nitrososphaerota archaeon]|nr:HEPN domain-containing protein [Nitrososphaerota archaeon]